MRSKPRGKTQIIKYTSFNTQLFHYSNDNNIEELARVVVVEHLSFSFGEKIDFVNNCQQALNHSTYHVLITTFTHTLLIFIKKENNFDNFFLKKIIGHVFIYSDIWSDH